VQIEDTAVKTTLILRMGNPKSIANPAQIHTAFTGIFNFGLACLKRSDDSTYNSSCTGGDVKGGQRKRIPKSQTATQWHLSYCASAHGMHHTKFELEQNYRMFHCLDHRDKLDSEGHHHKQNN
jgi:hypothetical protein